MALPKAYLTSIKNLKGILTAIQSGQAPPKFTVRFLESLGYKTPADRLVIGVLKWLKFLTQDGVPTQRYFDFLDQTQSARVLGEAIQDTYADLYQINKRAHDLSATEVKNKLRTLTQGQASDSVLDKMTGTFKALAQLADFTQPSKSSPAVESTTKKPEAGAPTAASTPADTSRLGGLVYNIQIVLPDSRDQAVYDVLFKSLKEHLLR